MVRPFSEQLADLSAFAKHAEVSIAKAMQEGRANLDSKRAEIHASATAQTERIKADVAGAETSVSGHWAELETRVKSEVGGIRERIDEKRDEHGARQAEKKASHAEDHAVNAIAFAMAAIVNAEDAVIDAVIAREKADSLSA